MKSGIRIHTCSVGPASSESTIDIRSAMQRRGYTLLELIVSLAASAVLVGGLMTAMIVASAASRQPGFVGASLRAAELTDEIADELSYASAVLSDSPDSVRLTTADRNGDNTVDVLEYRHRPADSAVELARDNRPAVTLADDVQLLTLEPTIRVMQEVLGGVVTESPEVTFNDQLDSYYASIHTLSPYDRVGSSPNFTQPSDCVSWNLSRFAFAMRRTAYAYPGESILVRVYAAGPDRLPTSTVLGSVSIPVNSIGTGWQWVWADFTGIERLMRNQRVCVVPEPQTASGNVQILYQASGRSPNDMMIQYSPYSSGWQLKEGSALLYSMRGTRMSADSTTHTVQREYFTSFRVTANLADETQARVTRTCRLLNTPERMSRTWRLDFDVPPTDSSVDCNRDDVGDWVNVTGSSAGAFSSGAFLMSGDQVIRSRDAHDFNSLITAELRFRDPSADSGGPTVSIPVSPGGSSRARIDVTAELKTNGTQSLRVTVDGNGSAQTVALLNGLPSSMIDVRLVADVPNQQLAVTINDIFSGRSTMPIGTVSVDPYVVIRTSSTAAEFDFLSVRCGR